MTNVLPESAPAIETLFAEFLQTWLAQSNWLVAPVRIGLAVSGGVDSVALLLAAAKVASKFPIQFSVHHVHHGLQASADIWATAVEHWARLVDFPCFILPVEVENSKQMGMEGAAREVRYQALLQQQKSLQLDAMMLAHHQDDQVETVLMRILRGTGLRGAQGMSPQIIFQNAGTPALFLRPWLTVPKADLVAYVASHPLAKNMSIAQDPTNYDNQYVRGWMRNYLVPVLQRFSPKYAENIQRFSRNLRSEAKVVDEYMQLLANTIEQDQGCDRAAFLKLSEETQAVFLRYWLIKTVGSAYLPSENVLLEWLLQIRRAGKPTKWLLAEGEFWLLQDWFRWVPRVSRVPVSKLSEAVALEETFYPNLEEVWLRAIGDTCHAVRIQRSGESGLGFSSEAIQGLPWKVSAIRPTISIRMAHDRPRKTMKHLFQERNIPEWQRKETLYIWIGNRLAYITGIGATQEYDRVSNGVQIEVI